MDGLCSCLSQLSAHIYERKNDANGSDQFGETGNLYKHYDSPGYAPTEDIVRHSGNSANDRPGTKAFRSQLVGPEQPRTAANAPTGSPQSRAGSRNGR